MPRHRLRPRRHVRDRGNLNEAIAAGDWTLYYTVDDATRKVTAADVKRVAGTYLDVNKSTTGWFIPLAATAPAAQ